LQGLVDNLIPLAPDIVAGILDETLPPEVTLFGLAAGTPLVWEEQCGPDNNERVPPIEQLGKQHECNSDRRVRLSGIELTFLVYGQLL
jgi:hypothetical protein